MSTPQDSSTLSDAETTETNPIGSVTKCRGSRFRSDSGIHLLRLSHGGNQEIRRYGEFDEMDVVEDEVKILFRDSECSLLAPRQSHKSPSYTERKHPQPSVERNALHSYSQTAS